MSKNKDTWTWVRFDECVPQKEGGLHPVIAPEWNGEAATLAYWKGGKWIDEEMNEDITEDVKYFLPAIPDTPIEKVDNELIAEFMGIDFTSPDAYSTYPTPLCKRFGEYDRSWQWLMPVVDKIIKIRCAPDSKVDLDTFFLRTFGMINPQTGKYMVRFNRCVVFEANTLFDALYMAVVDFIKLNRKSGE